MSANYEVVAVSDTVRDWDSTKGGPMKGYRVHLKGEDGGIVANCEWSRKQTSPAPTVGQKLYGDIDLEAQYGPKFKQAQQGGGGGGGSYGKSPGEQRMIAMQASHKVAVDVTRIAVDAGLWKPETPEAIAAAVVKVGDRLFMRIEEVGA